MRVLVVKPTALGDVAQALLVAPELKRSGFCKQLDWLVDEHYQDLVRLSPEVDRVITFPRSRWRRSRRLDHMFVWLRRLASGGYDLTLDLQGLARSGLMTCMTHAPRRIGLRSAREFSRLAYNEFVRDDAIHAVDRYAQAVGHCLEREVHPQPLAPAWLPESSLPLPEPPYVILHPFSQRSGKLWPWQRYEAVARALPDIRFVIIGQGTAFPVLAENVIDLRNRTSLSDLITLIARAEAMVSTDSGPVHMAVLLGKPVVAIFGATSPRRTGPRGEKVIVLDRSPEVEDYGQRRLLNDTRAAERMASIGVEDVVEALGKIL
jgi:heptosyltransferase-1